VPSEAAEIALVLDRIARGVLEELQSLPEEALNRQVPLPETNSLFALATHLVGAGEFWVLGLAGGRTIQRDRDAEFRASGSFPDLEARYERWVTALHEVLDGMPPERLDQPTNPPAAYLGGLSERPTVRECLLHMVEHGALHQGHIQITRQIIAGARGGAE
jgi:uncharacterized damage-inducible protein DinB